MFTSLFAGETINYNVSLEYSISEKFKLFKLKNVIKIEIDDRDIEIKAEGFGKSILDENLQYNNLDLSENSLLSTLLVKKIVPDIEDMWIDRFFLINKLAVKTRFLFSEEIGGQRLYRLDIKQLNKEDVDNLINKVILDSDIIKIWADKDNQISKLTLMYKNITYVVYIKDEE